MNLSDARAGLATVLSDVGIRVYDAVPENVEPPCAVVGVGSGTYDEDVDGTRVEWSVLVLVSRADDMRAQYAIDGYLSTSGADSIPAAVRTDATLDATVDSARVVGWDEPQTYEVGQVSYIGVSIQVEAIG